MSISRRVFLTSCLAAGAFAFVGRPRHELLHQERWYLFGTLVDVAIADPDRARVARALAGLSAEMKAMHTTSPIRIEDIIRKSEVRILVMSEELIITS